MNQQDPNQVYHDGQAEGYTGFTDCDANVYGWARSQLSPEQVAQKTVIDFGCGQGSQTFSHLRENGAALLVGVEASEDMLKLVADYQNQIRREVDNISLEFLALITCFAEKEHFQLLIQGKMEEVSRVIPGTGDVGVNLFNVLCFDNPAEPIGDMRTVLKPGAPLVIVSNAFVDARIPLKADDPYRSVPVDIHAAENGQEVESGTVFRQVLHLVDDQGQPSPLALQDHIHTLGDYSRALPKDQWTIRSAEVFPPQGCTLIDPQGTSPYLELFNRPEFQKNPRLIHSGIQDARLQYGKICIVAERS